MQRVHLNRVCLIFWKRKGKKYFGLGDWKDSGGMEYNIEYHSLSSRYKSPKITAGHNIHRRREHPEFQHNHLQDSAD